MYGFGTVIGASVLVALSGGIIAATIDQLDVNTDFSSELTEPAVREN